MDVVFFSVSRLHSLVVSGVNTQLLIGWATVASSPVYDILLVSDKTNVSGSSDSTTS